MNSKQITYGYLQSERGSAGIEVVVAAVIFACIIQAMLTFFAMIHEANTNVVAARNAAFMMLENVPDENATCQVISTQPDLTQVRISGNAKDYQLWGMTLPDVGFPQEQIVYFKPAQGACL